MCLVLIVYHRGIVSYSLIKFLVCCYFLLPVTVCVAVINVSIINISTVLRNLPISDDLT